jgi:hypothetical protein
MSRAVTTMNPSAPRSSETPVIRPAGMVERIVRPHGQAVFSDDVRADRGHAVSSPAII